MYLWCASGVCDHLSEIIVVHVIKKYDNYSLLLILTLTLCIRVNNVI